MKNVKNRLWLLLLGLLFLAAASRPAMAMDGAAGDGALDDLQELKQMFGTMFALGLTVYGPRFMELDGVRGSHQDFMTFLKETRDKCLFASIRNNCLWETHACLALGADVEGRDEEGETALLCAVLHNRMPQARLLIDAGADTEAANSTGKTPLMIASARAANPYMIQLLLRAGSRVDVVDRNNMTPLALAAPVGTRFALPIVKNGLIKGYIDQLEGDTHGQVAIVSD